jgi:hypothetical protein
MPSAKIGPCQIRALEAPGAEWVFRFSGFDRLDSFV